MGHNRVNCTNIDPETGASTFALEPSNEQGVDDQEFAQFVDNSNTLEVDVICIM